MFAVTDNGPGIPTEVQDRVFDWFETHPLGSRHRGAGLGLSIVRSFVELHGGTVTLDSTVGQGTTVVCTFPLDLELQRTASRPGRAGAGPGFALHKWQLRSCHHPHRWAIQ